MPHGFRYSSLDYGPDLHVPYGETSMIPMGKPVFISVNVANKIRESFVFQVEGSHLFIRSQS